MKEIDFVAVDFETMTPELTSACSVGLVKVKNGIIVQKFYSLIKPIPDGRPERNTWLHHISDDMVADAPTFADLFPSIVNFVEGLTFVSHNRSTDMNIISRCMAYYGLKGLSIEGNIDTLDIYHKRLDVCCEENGVILDNHHDALADAEACAKLLLCYFGHVSRDFAETDIALMINDHADREYVHETLMPLDDDEIENPNTIFFHKRVVITGVLDAFTKRDDLGLLLKSYGANVNKTISGLTDIVIIGHRAGPSKLAKIDTLNQDGCNIRVVYEPELIKILNNIDKENGSKERID